jgi:hypothetical protein
MSAAAPFDRESQVLDLLDEIRQRLQTAHFNARGLNGPFNDEPREPVADQLHGIRLLADGLAQALRQ